MKKRKVKRKGKAKRTEAKRARARVVEPKPTEAKELAATPVEAKAEKALPTETKAQAAEAERNEADVAAAATEAEPKEADAAAPAGASQAPATEAEPEEADAAPAAETQAPAAEAEAKEADAAAPAAATQAPAADPDDVSVPPAGDLDAHEQFFSEGDLSPHLASDDEGDDEALTVVDKAKRKLDPAVVERRTRFSRYVKGAVALAAVVCLAAVGRSLSSPSSSRVSAVPPPAPAEAASAARAADRGAASPAMHADSARTPTEGEQEPQAVEARATANEESAKPGAVLEQHDAAAAIEAAGERTVARDASDAGGAAPPQRGAQGELGRR